MTQGQWAGEEHHQPPGSRESRGDADDVSNSFRIGALPSPAAMAEAWEGLCVMTATYSPGRLRLPSQRADAQELPLSSAMTYSMMA